MRILAYLIITASLLVGVIGAVTAYLPRIDAAGAGQRLAGLHLNAGAGLGPAVDSPATLPATAPTTAPASDGPVPLVATGAALTADNVDALRNAGVTRVRVREFSFSRWTGWWMFALGCGGLLAAGLYLRHDSTRALAALDAPGATTRRADPGATLAAMRSEVASLIGSVGTVPSRRGDDVPLAEVAYAAPDVRVPAFGRSPLCEQIMARVGAIQVTHMPAFIDARPRLVAAFGMAGYARLMDAYAAAERSLNRAWSAAADGAEAEALAALDRGLALLDESASRLPGR